MGVIAIESQDYDGVASTQDVFDSWGKHTETLPSLMNVLLILVVAIAYRYRLCWCSSHEVINLSCYYSWLGISGLQRKLSLVEIAFVSTFLARKEDRPSSSLLGLSLEFVPSKVSSGGNGTQVLATKTLASSGRMINVLTGWYPESSWQPNKDCWQVVQSWGHDDFRLSMATTFPVAEKSAQCKAQQIMRRIISRQMTFMSMQA